MPRHRRCIVSNRVYMFCFRAVEGLPIAATNYMRLILLSIIARVQRDSKVVLNHFLYMGNHPHIIGTAKDSLACTQFYGEIMKQTTESVKRLLGLDHLELWESCSVIELADEAAVQKEIAYLYNNPTKANLVDRIEEHPLLNSWADYQKAANTIDACIEIDCPWIRLPMIGKLPVRSMTEKQDKYYTVKLTKKTKDSHTLKIQPNYWMKYLCSDTDKNKVEQVNESIVSTVKKNEDDYREIRTKERKKCIGVRALRAQPIMKNHNPKKRSCDVFVIACDNELRIKRIQEYKYFCLLCEQAYQKWKLGDYTVIWPPGSFRPAMPPTVNLIQ